MKNILILFFALTILMVGLSSCRLFRKKCDCPTWIKSVPAQKPTKYDNHPTVTDTFDNPFQIA